MAGTKVANATIRIYTLAYNAAPTLFATDGSPVSPSTYNITYGSPNNVANTSWEYNGANNGGTVDPCSGGANDMPNGSFYITVTEPGKCESAPIWGSCVNSTSTTAPSITQTVLYTGVNTISGNNTQAAAVTIRLFVNGFLVAATNVGASAPYSFSNVSLQTGDVVTVRAQATGQCISSPATLTTTCFTSSPLISTDLQGNLTAGVTTVSGTSSEPAGTTIRVYVSTTPGTPIGTAAVLANGTWSATVSPALAAGSVYYATAQNSTCSVSANSANATARTTTTICPTITGSYSEGAGTVSGTLPSSFTGTVYLYQDGALIGSASVTASTNWTVTISSANPLYAGGELSVAAQATGGTLNKNCASTTTVTCSAPAAPVVSPLSTTISAGQSVTYTITGTVSGALYSILDNSTGTSYTTSKFGNGSDQNFTTLTFTNPGSYTLRVEADKLSGSTCRSSTTVTLSVSGTLPVTLTRFTATRDQGQVRLLDHHHGNQQQPLCRTAQHAGQRLDYHRGGGRGRQQYR
jgi:plastocyanin